MIDQAVHSERGIEAVLRAELARSDAVAHSVLPILRHLVAAEDSAIFSDEILARIRGMLAYLVDRLLGGPDIGAEPQSGGIDLLTRSLLGSPGLLSHLHAIAIEWQLTERLQARLGLDPVVSLLLQALITSADPQMQGLGMTYLAAQARWCQAQRRMNLPLRELPGDLLHEVLLVAHSAAVQSPELAERIAKVEADVRQSYEEGASRLGLASRLIMSLGDDAHVALSVDGAGVSLFLTALALGSGQRRDLTVLSTQEGQSARFALMLCSAGLEPSRVHEQLLTLHPEATLPSGFETMSAEVAAIILTSGQPGQGFAT